MTETIARCEWAGLDPLYLNYHDREWGVPVHDDRRLFEKICLEGAQAGLSWLTILRKRDNYRKVFDDFGVRRVAGYGEAKIEALLEYPGIVRNRMKVESTVNNAAMLLEVKGEFGSFDQYIWEFVGGKGKKNAWKTVKEIPARTPESEAMSRDMKKRGFKFIGPTICYAFMQGVGMVNDHTIDCFRYDEV